MNLDTLKKAGVYLDRCRFAVVPEIPVVQDVLYALRMSDEQKYYDFCLSNHEIYVTNVHLVAAAVGFEVASMRPYDEARARKIIAQAILDLTRPKDKCLFDSALAEAAEVVVGKPAPSKFGDRETLLATCGCASCDYKNDHLEEIWRDEDEYDSHADE